MVDPPISNSANLQSDDVLEELESQIVDLSRQAEELAEESENLEKELTEERLNNEKLSSDLELSIEEMNKAVSDSAVHLEALESERIKSEKIVLAEAKKNNEIELLRDKISELEIVGTTKIPQLSGSWTGIIAQNNVSYTYPIELEISDSSIVVSYGEPVSCAGRIEVLSSDLAVIDGRERLNEGNCINNGTVQLVLTHDSRLAYHWSKEGEVAATILERKK